MRCSRAGLLAVVLILTTTSLVAAESSIPSAPTARRVIVSLRDRQLAVVENDQIVERISVAVGAPATPSPVGIFTVVNRITNPTYYRPGKVIAPGPGNPLGTRWIGLSLKGYGIHGTDDPDSVGQAKSQGCIRLRNVDVERLFDRLRPGDVVELHPERTPEIDRFFRNQT